MGVGGVARVPGGPMNPATLPAHAGAEVARVAHQLGDQATVARALALVGTGRYALGCGGRDPAAPLGPYRRRPGDPDAIYAARRALGRVWLDCSGYLAASWGVDRYQPTGIAGGWLSCAALYADARGPQRWCRAVPVGEVLPGDGLVWDGHPGHCCVVVARPEVVERYADLEVAQCRSGRAPAIVRSTGAAWDRRSGIAVRRVG